MVARPNSEELQRARDVLVDLRCAKIVSGKAVRTADATVALSLIHI